MDVIERELKLYENIELIKKDSVAWIMLNNPHRANSLSDPLCDDIIAALDECEADENVRVMVLGARGKGFSAGFDIGPREKPIEGILGWRDQIKFNNGMMWKIWNLTKPIIAMVHGYCLGGGCDLAVLCDITVAGRSARFGEPEVRFGSAVAFPIFPWILGMKKTSELLFTGDQISAEEAERIGLINRVVEDDVLEETVENLAVKISKMPPVSLAFNRLQIRRGLEMQGFTDNVLSSQELFVCNMLSEDPVKSQFREKVEQDGLSSAVKWMNRRVDGGE